MRYLYPQEQQELFTNRHMELAELVHYRDTLLRGQPEHAALFGPRRIGKTLLLKEFLRQTLEQETGVAPVYMDFTFLCSSPEQFAAGYVGHICYWLITQGEETPEPYLTPMQLPNQLLLAGERELYDAIQPILRLLERTQVDRQALLRQAFRFPQIVREQRGVPQLLILDEFQELRTLENFPGAENALALFRAALQSQEGILYLLAGSAVTVLTRILSDPAAPLFAQFTKLSLGPFSREETVRLVTKLLPEAVDPQIAYTIHHLTGGYPFYVQALCRRTATRVEAMGMPLSPETVREAFVVETLSTNGRIYDFCRYIYDLSLQQATGYGSLKAVLQILAAEEGLTAADVARQLRVTPATASDYLRWLREVNLVSLQEGRYYFRDPVLRYWVAYATQGVEVSARATGVDIGDLITRLDARFQAAARELGVSQEARVRELLRRFAGQEVEGRLLGLPEGTIRLPQMVSVDTYRSPDGQVELDAVARTADGGTWVVEVKWAGRQVSRRELERWQAKAEAAQLPAEVTLWYVSRSGFSQEAKEYAAKHGISLTDRTGFETLVRMVSR
ncbi:MAG: AAA family ATPase [Chloroflexi bacterium]|nr:AAA family ATPase [Chloroflexota bacterium]